MKLEAEDRELLTTIVGAAIWLCLALVALIVVGAALGLAVRAFQVVAG